MPKVKFPEKKAELMRLLDEMGEDDNPIIAIYKLKIEGGSYDGLIW